MAVPSMPLPVNPLKDVVLRMQLPASLEGDVNAFVGKPQPTDAPGHRAYCAEAAAIADRCVEHIEGEIAKLTEQRFAMGDAGGIKQRQIADPKRQADAAVAALKQKIAGEKGEWSRRAAKQALDVLDSVERELREMKSQNVAEPGGLMTTVEDAWGRTFFAWLDDSLTTWSRHVEQMLPQKTLAAIEGEARTVGGHLAQPLSLKPPAAASLVPSPSRLEVPPLKETAEVPTVFEAFFEMFKGGLNTAAMLAGLVVVPVVGSLSHEQPVALRAIVMSSFIVPIIVFAVMQTRRTRRKLTDRGTEKSGQKLKRDLEVFCKTKVERFRGEVERFAHNYIATAQTEMIAFAEAAVARTFAQKEESLASELARAQLQADRLAEQINTFKQVRGALTGTFLVEARRRMRDLDAA